MRENTNYMRSKKRRQAQQRRARIALILGVVVVALIIWAITAIVANHGESDNPAGGGPDSQLAGTAGDDSAEGGPQEPVTMSINCVGDIMMHSTQADSMHDSSGEINLETYFSYVKPIVEKADLSLCNIESPFAGPPYLGYPVFSVPDELAVIIKEAGFDVGITANNHMLDQGFEGLIMTVDAIKNAGLEVAGSRKDPAEKNYIVMDVKGIKVGVVAYTYETSMLDGSRTMNGTYMSDEAKTHLNSYIPGNAEDEAQITKSIADARADGAQVVVCYLHWGEEYQRQENSSQRATAQVAADGGADIIFGSHPHVPQPMELLKSGEREVPVFWSMGNYISNQRAETLDNKYTEQGIIANVDLTYDPVQAKITELIMSYTPLWVDKYHDGYRHIYAVVPLVGDFMENPTLQASGNGYRAESALQDLNNLLGEHLIWNINHK